MTEDDVNDWRAALLGPAAYPPSPHALRWQERLAAMVLAVFVGPDGTAAPGLGHLAHGCGVSQRSVATYLAGLERAQWIARCPFTTSGRTTYRLTWPQPALERHLLGVTDDTA